MTSAPAADRTGDPFTGSAAFYRQLVDSLPAAVYTTDREGRIALYNDAAVELWGRRPEPGEQWCGSGRIFRPDGSALALDQCPMAVALREGRAVEGVEVIVERPDGTRRNVLPSPRLLLDDSGVVIGAVNMLLDITSRRHAERALRESETILREVADTAPVMIWMSGLDKGRYWFNKRWLDFVGRPMEHQMGEGWAQSVHADDLERYIDMYQRAFNARMPFTMEYRLRRADGEYRWILAHGTPMQNADGEFTGFIGTCADITERRKIELECEQLLVRESEARFEAQTLNEVSRALTSELDMHRLVQGVTDAGTKLTLARFGAFFYNTTDAAGDSYTLYTLTGAPREAFESFGLPRKTPLFQTTFEGSGVVRCDDVLKHPDYGHNHPHHGMPAGHLPVRSYLAVPVISRGGAVIGGLFFGHPQPGVFTERAERLAGGLASLAAIAIDNAKLYQSLGESEARFRTLADNMAQFAWMADATGTPFWYNQRWHQYTGTTTEQMRSAGWAAVHHPKHAQRVTQSMQRAWDSGEPWEDVFPLRGKDGEYRWFLSRALPIRDERGRVTRWFGTNTDITERRALEEQLALHRAELERRVEQRTRELTASHERLRVAERLAMMGTLAAGLGHDMGNLLVPVRVRLDSLSAQPLGSQAREDVESIRTSAEYLRRLATGLRMLSTDPQRSPAGDTTDVADWWADAAGVLKSVLPRGIALESQLPAHTCRIALPKAALTQAVFNLIQNAGDTMRERGRGTVTVTARGDGDAVELKVADDGPGMTSEVKRRCMEPYFSTKARGISTGLGLVLVYGFVKEAGGTVSLDSGPGRGTTFTMRFPLIRPSHGALPSAVPRLAVVNVSDDRMRSLISGEVRAMGFEVSATNAPTTPASLLVLDDAAPLESTPSDPPVILLAHRESNGDERVQAIGPRPGLAKIRDALRRAAHQTDPPPSPIPHAPPRDSTDPNC